MDELTLFKKRINRFQNSLQRTIELFRKGEDHPGLDSFLSMIDDMEILLEFYPHYEGLQERIESLLTAFQKICLCMQNQDVVGMTDLLEFKLSPLTKEWLKEYDEK